MAASYNTVNALTNFGGTAFAWDAAGELASDGVRNYGWDAENRLVGINYIGPNEQIAFGYDGMGRRTSVATTVNGSTTTTWYVWCGAHICQSENGDGTIDRQYYPEGEYIPAQQASLYYGPDRLGSVRDVWATSPLFQIKKAYDYDPRGNPLVTPTQGLLSDFRWIHMLYHPDSGLYPHRAPRLRPAHRMRRLRGTRSGCRAGNWLAGHFPVDPDR